MSTSGDWQDFAGVAASTHAMEAYGGIRLPRSAIYDLVESLNRGELPMLGHHDRARPVRTRGLRAQAREVPDGELVAEVSGQVHVGDWNQLGDVRAFSLAVGQDLDPGQWPTPREPVLTIAADAAWFDAVDIAAASSLVSPLGALKAQEYFQFSALPDAKIIIETTMSVLSGVGLDVACSAIWDGIKFLWARRRTPVGGDGSAPTTIELHMQDRQLDFVVRTSSDAVAEQAINALPGVLAGHRASTKASQRKRIVWQPPDEDSPPGRWVAP